MLLQLSPAEIQTRKAFVARTGEMVKVMTAHVTVAGVVDQSDRSTSTLPARRTFKHGKKRRHAM